MLFSRKEDDFLYLNNNNEILFITFGGINQKLGIDVPPFEFAHSLHTKKCDVIFLRDTQQAWYQFGAKGIAKNVDGIADFLRKHISNYKLTITIGNSMGGYASILFGSILGCDISLAFSPQTFIDEYNRVKNNDDRWSDQMMRFHKKLGDSYFYDLYSFMTRQIANMHADLQTRFYLFYGAKNDIDKIHCTRMASLKPFHLFELKDANHNAAQTLRDHGVLDLLLDALSRNDANHEAISRILRESSLINIDKRNPDSE